MALSTNFVTRFKPIIFLLLLIPSLYWLSLFFLGNLGINPIDRLMDELGLMAIRLLILTLMISSLSRSKFFRSFQNIRRMIGLFAFYYVVLHFLTYLVLDHFFNFKFILKDVLKRPFITFGFTSFLLLIPLAITSTDSMIKKITFKIWKRIHYLIYIITPLAALHYFLITKSDKTEPLIYIFIILFLLMWRLYQKLIKN